MHAGFAILVWLINFGISFWNAYAVGLAWVETQHRGGWPRIVAWSGAVMSASGFSWCYLLILTFAGYELGWLDYGHMTIAMQIGYIVLVPGVLCSGMVITLDSWARLYRQRTIGTVGRAAWNTYAQIHNTFNAISNLDSAFGSVMDSFPSKSSGDSGDKKGGAVVFILIFVLVVLALVSGILTTAVIISRTAGNDKLPDEPSEA